MLKRTNIKTTAPWKLLFHGAVKIDKKTNFFSAQNVVRRKCLAVEYDIRKMSRNNLCK